MAARRCTTQRWTASPTSPVFSSQPAGKDSHCARDQLSQLVIDGFHFGMAEQFCQCNGQRWRYAASQRRTLWICRLCEGVSERPRQVLDRRLGTFLRAQTHMCTHTTHTQTNKDTAHAYTHPHMHTHAYTCKYSERRELELPAPNKMQQNRMQTEPT